MATSNFKTFAASVALAFGAFAAIPASAIAAEDVNLGFINALSGGSAPMGASSLAGFKVAIAEINAQGGILGRKIVPVVRDDQAKPENGPVFAQELIKNEKVAAAFGFCNTGVGLPASKVFQDSKTILFVPCATGVPLTAPENTFVFRTSASDKIQTAMLIADARKHGAKKIALFTDTTNYGKLIHDGLVMQGTAQGATIVAEESFAVGDKDMTSQVMKAKAAGADWIITGCIAPEAAVIAKNMVKLGYKVPMSGSWTLSMTNFAEGAGKASDGVTMPSTFLQLSAKGDRQSAFVNAAVKEYGSPILGSGPAAAQTYDAVYIYKAAVEQANSFDSEKVRAALENLTKPVEGVIKTYNRPFFPGGHDAQTAESVGMGIVNDGKVTMRAK